MKFIHLAGGLALAVGAAAPALAQTDTQALRFYGGVELGLSTLNDSTADTTSPLVAALGGTASGTQDTNGSSARMFGGYHLSPSVSLELGYYQSSETSQRLSGVASSGLSYSGSGSVCTTGFDYSLLLRPGHSVNGNGAFLRLGGHYLTVFGRATLTGTTTAISSSNSSGSGVLWGVGYDMPIQNRLSARFEYTGIRTIAGKSGTADNFSLGLVSRF